MFDIKDVRRASVLLLAQAPQTTIPTEYNSAALCAWQQSQLDPTHDGAFKQTDAVYLLNALAKKYRFLDSIAAGELSSGGTAALQVSIDLYDETSAPAAAKTKAAPKKSGAPSSGGGGGGSKKVIKSKVKVVQVSTPEPDQDL